MTTPIGVDDLRDVLVKIVDDALRPLAERVSSLERSAADVESAATAESANGHAAEAAVPDVATAEPPAGEKDVRARIIDAALDLFHEQGYDATGVQEIVERAGVTKGALYHYFRSKENLLLSIREEFISDLLRRGHEILDENESAAEALRLIVRDLILLVKTRRSHMTVGFFETRLDLERFPKAQAQRNEWESVLVEIIDRGVRSGEFRRDVRPVRAAAVIGTLAWAAYNWFPGDVDEDPDAVAADLSELVLSGLFRDRG
ncbi:TetR/AcrR family transcriptional regulator [Cryptosporangium sp. NPDC051539]|uniref:TetR/AcrR family transcriptional regulator n=1 Tax=Cryptosporangium sp. NPDC051539 TaxID=3363962 RepID=UPI00379EA7CE